MPKNLSEEEKWKQTQRFLKYIDPEQFRVDMQLDYNYQQARKDLLKKIHEEHALMAPSFRADAQYLLTENEWKLFETTVGAVLRHKSKVYEAIRTSPAGRTGPFGAETVEYYTYNDLTQARFTNKFLQFDEDIMSIAVGTKNTYGPSKGIYLDMQQVASARRVGRPIVEDHAREATLKIAEKEEMFLALGTAHYNWPADELIGGATGLTAIFNDASVNTLGANGGGIDGDDDMQAAGDFVHTVGHMVAKLQEDKFYGDSGYILIMTPGLVSQLAINANATRGTTEWETVRAYLQDSDVKFKIVNSKYIGEASAALAANTQEMCLLDPDPRGIELIETYPMGTKLELTPKKPGDVHFAIVGQAALVIKDAKCICITVTLTAGGAF